MNCGPEFVRLTRDWETRGKLSLRRLFLYVGQGFSLATVCTRNRATLKGRPTTALKFLYIKFFWQTFILTPRDTGTVSLLQPLQVERRDSSLCNHTSKLTIHYLMKKLPLIFYTLTVLQLVSTEGLCADFRKGWDAFNNGDSAAALQEWKPLARQGNAKAQFLVSAIYLNGAGIRPDYKESARWCRLAAEQTYPPAQHTLGFMYGKGHGVPQDNNEAAKWYRLAADQNYAPALNNLGLMYYDGQGVIQNYEEAAKWLLLAAEQGVPEAQFLIGMMHFKGKGIPQNYKKASNWLRLAADQGLAVAQTNLGVMYLKGQGVPQDHREAGRLFKLAAEKGNGPAQYRLGMMYEHGRGMHQDYVNAYLWHCLGALQGNKIARERLDTIKKRLLPLQIEEAQGLVREWLIKHRM